MRYPVALTVPIELRRAAAPPLYEQIADQLGTAVDEGRLAAGAPLPSTRTLGALLGVSRGVVATAYDVLSARGYLRGRAGSGSFVVPPAGAAHAPPAPEPPELDLRPGGPSPDEFPIRQWRAAWRRASFAPPVPHPPPSTGLPELRRAVAEHLRDTRGHPPGAGEIVITAGVPAGLRLVLEALGLAGARVALEDPAPPELRRAVPAGGQAAPLPVDVDGVRFGVVRDACRAVVLSPDGNDPLGCRLAAARRRQAAAWARRTGGWLVEVAGTGMPAPRAGQLPALSALAGDRTVLVGGFRAVLGPGLGVGYVVVPAALAGRIRALADDRVEHPPYPLQQVVAELLAGGTVTRLAHRLAGAGARKQRLAASVLRPLGQLAGGGAPGTTVLRLAGGRDARAAAGALRARGVRTRPLAEYHAPGWLPAQARTGLVIGYGHLPDPALRAGLARLARELTRS